MDRLYAGYNPNDAEVDSLLSQLNDESLMKLKVNSHSHKTSAASCGFEYPTFTDGWTNDGDDDDDDDDGRRGGRGDLDNQLASRFSSLKLPISSVKKKGRDPSAGLGTAMGRKKGSSNSDRLARKGSGGGRDYHHSQADSGGRSAADYWEALGKQGRDSGGLGRRRSSRDYEAMGKKGRDLQAGVWKGRNLEAVGEEGEEEDEEEQEQLEREDGARNSIKASTRSENGSHGKQPQQQQQSKGESSRALSQKTELLSCKSSDDLAAAALAASDEDGDELDNIDAQLHERFRALKAPPPPPSPARPPPGSTSNRNAGLDNLLQFSEQQQQQQQQSMISTSNSNEYDSFGSSFSTPTSPSAKLLGRSKSRSSPRVMTTSVSSSCHCSTPSPLKLLKQVSSKTFPAKQQYHQHQQLPHSSSGGLPPTSSSVSAPSSRSPPLKSRTMGSGRDFKVEGFGNSKPSSAVKESEKPVNERKEKEKKSKRESKKETKEDAKKDTTAKKQTSNNGSGGGGIGNSVENSGSSGPSTTVKDMKRLLSSVADRVGLERSRVSSAEEDDFLGEDLRSWAVVDDGQPEDDDDDEFARVSTEEENLNREAERVIEWAKDAARLGSRVGVDSDEDSDDDAFKLGSDDDGDSDSGDSYPSDEAPSKKEKKVQKEAKGPSKKKKWGLFN